MKILIATIAQFMDTPGGASRIAWDEAVELRSQGHDVWILAPGKSSLPEYQLKDGIHLLRYAPPKIGPWNPSRASSHQKAATALLKRHLPEVDAIHGHVPLPFLAALNFYDASVRACYTVHSPARMEMAIGWRNAGLLRRLAAPAGLALINRMEAECLRRSTAITALSQFTIDCLRRIHGRAAAAAVQLVPGWVDTARFVPAEDRERAKAQMGWPTDAPVLFTLRRLSPRMGLDRLISAAHQVRSQGFEFRLMIGGAGPEREKLDEQVRTLGLGDCVRFLGRLEEQELPVAYAACDAFVLPTAELECFGLIALEALSAGRPVLATPVGAIPEIIRKFEPAWLARSSAAEDIASLLREFLAGELPMHDPASLHAQVDRDYSRDRMLCEFITAAIGHQARLI